VQWQWFSTSSVARPARMRPTGNLQAQTVPSSPAVGGWPQINYDTQAAIGLGSSAARAQAKEAITDVAE